MEKLNKKAQIINFISMILPPENVHKNQILSYLLNENLNEE